MPHWVTAAGTTLLAAFLSGAFASYIAFVRQSERFDALQKEVVVLRGKFDTDHNWSVDMNRKLEDHLQGHCK